MSKRPKTADEMTRDELQEVKWGGDVPVIDDAATLEAAGLDPETREPLPTQAERKQRIEREEEIEDAEALSVEDWVTRAREGA